MFLQSLVIFHQGLFKILWKQNVSDTLSFVRSDGRTDNVKTVYPPTNIVCGGYNKTEMKVNAGNTQLCSYTLIKIDDTA